MIKLKILLSTVWVCILVYGCSSYRYASVHDMMESQKKPIVNVNKQKAERKIIFSASISMVVAFPDSTNNRLRFIAKKYEGYIQDISSRKSVIRVQKDHFNEAIEEISTMGKVLDKNISGQDVSEKFQDYQIRLENAKKIRLRYLELLKKAKSVDEMLKVEKELERINENIELLQGTLNKLNDLSQFSTISIDFKEEKKPGILGYVGIGLYKSVKWMFVRN